VLATTLTTDSVVMEDMISVYINVEGIIFFPCFLYQPRANIMLTHVINQIFKLERSGGRSTRILPSVGGPQEKMSFFQIASGPILSIPIYLKTCLYVPCKFSLKKMTPSSPTNPPKSAFFVTSDWTSDSVGFTSYSPFTGFFTKD